MNKKAYCNKKNAASHLGKKKIKTIPAIMSHETGLLFSDFSFTDSYQIFYSIQTFLYFPTH